MKAVYTKPELEVFAVAVEAGFAISQPDGGELGPTSEDYSDNGNLTYKFPLQTTIYLLISSITTSSTGLSKEFVFTAAILSSTSNPSITSPYTVYCPSKWGVPPTVV